MSATAPPDKRPINVLWLTSGLGCDGDSVAMTSATSPSIEDLLRGCLPGMPPLILHNPMLAYENGADFVRAFHDAAAGLTRTVHPRTRGIGARTRRSTATGHWTWLRRRPRNRPADHLNTWIDRLAPRADALLALGTCAAYGGIPAMRNNPTGAMGLRDYLGWEWESRRGIPIVNLPGCPVQPDNITEMLLALVLHVANMGPVPELDAQGRPRGSVLAHGP